MSSDEAHMLKMRKSILVNKQKGSQASAQYLEMNYNSAHKNNMHDLKTKSYLNSEFK